MIDHFYTTWFIAVRRGKRLATIESNYDFSPVSFCRIEMDPNFKLSRWITVGLQDKVRSGNEAYGADWELTCVYCSRLR